MAAPLDRETLEKYLESSPFIRASGIRLNDMEPALGRLALSMPFLPHFERAPGSGQFHGGPIAALIDTAGCFALIMQTGHGVPTLNFSTDYLRPARSASLLAVATVRRAGRTVGVVDVDVFSAEDALVAVGRGAFGTQQG